MSRGGAEGESEARSSSGRSPMRGLISPTTARSHPEPKSRVTQVLPKALFLLLFLPYLLF